MDTKLCRLCGKLSQNFRNIFKTEGLRDKIETCLPIFVSPYCLLPDSICEECLENINNFYTFMKECLQNIIILEAQYDVQESCLKSKRKKEKSCYVDFVCKGINIGVQTEDYLDVLVGKNEDLKQYSLNFPLITKFLDTSDLLKTKSTLSLVDYDIDSDSSLGDESHTGNVILGEKLGTFEKITNFVDSFLSQKHSFSKINYFDESENDLISEISRRKNLKRKRDFIENTQTKIFKRDTFNRRKNKQPKKLDSQVMKMGGGLSFNFETFASTCQNENENSSLNSLEKIDYLNGETDSQQIDMVQSEKLLSSLPQSCLLCDTHFCGPTALAAHVFEMHGIDLAEVVSSGSGESFPEKNKKKIPNLVKISDLKRDENHLPDQEAEDPPMLLPSFVCPNCPAIFTTKPDLMMHLRAKHAQQAAYLCGICLQQCNTYINLKSHLEICTQQHPINSKYICEICQYGDDNFKSLENHVLVHDFLLDSCKKESKMFDPDDYIKANEKYEHKALSPSSKSLSCSECGLNDFDSFKDFSSHRRNQHSIFHCDLCNKFYGRNSHLWKHVNRLHKGHPSITCQLCYKTSASKYHLAQHFNKIHLAKGTKQKTDIFQSETEDFMTQKFQGFDFQSVKQCFMRQEIMEREKKNSISEIEDNTNPMSDQDDELTPDFNVVNKDEIASAPKEIDSSHNLYTNIITNYTPPLNKGEYKCPKCLKAFHKKVLLKKHKKNCRPKLQKDLLTRCKTCARIFKDRQSLAKHLVNYHSEYECEICHEKVQSKCEIVAHIRFQHPGCHLFCKICSNILRSKEDLQVHLQDHLDSYVCQFCADSLPSKIKLKMHILSLHRKILSLSCGICLKLFETQHILKDHVTLVHKDQLAPLTSCPVCGKNYGSKWKTYDHLNKSHGRIFKACKTCLEVFENDAQLQAHYDVTLHSGQGTSHINATTVVKNNVMAHIATAINEVASHNDENNDEEDSDTGDENDENSEQSNDEYEEEIEVPKEDVQTSILMQESKISLLEKRLLGKKISEDDKISPKTQPMISNNNRSNSNSIETNLRLPSESKKVKKQTVAPIITNIKKEDDSELANSPYNPQVNSSKRTVYVNSNDPSYCEICFKTWPAKKHLWQHYIRCHKSVAATVCGICLKTNDSYESLQRHLRETHPTLLHGQGFGSNFICRICGRYHNASSKLRLHMVIHENFDWNLISNPPEPQGQDMEKKTGINGINEIKEEQLNDNIEVYDENDINYESLIEQVECSSQSENEDSENEQSHIGIKEDQASSLEEEEEEESEESENSMQAQMLKNMMNEKQKLNSDLNHDYASSSEDSSSSFSDDNNEGTKSESSEEECSHDSQSASSHGKFIVRSDSNTNMEESILNGNLFKHKPDELDSAIKSISYECMEPEDIKVEDDYCELHNNCLNDNEIESAVGSIL